jgi:hypothetical protein
MKCYESSKWYVRIWRKRWYFIIPCIFIKRNIWHPRTLNMIIEQPNKHDRKILINSWFEIKKHIELTKLQRFS